MEGRQCSMPQQTLSTCPSSHLQQHMQVRWAAGEVGGHVGIGYGMRHEGGKREHQGTWTGETRGGSKWGHERGAMRPAGGGRQGKGAGNASQATIGSTCTALMRGNGELQRPNCMQSRQGGPVLCAMHAALVHS